LVKVGVSGVAATAVDVLTLVALVEVGASQVTIAAFLAATAGGVTNFVINKYWAFADRSRLGVRQVSSYALVALVTAMFVAASVHVLAVLLGLPYLLAKAIAAILVFVFWSYPAQARIVFRRHGTATAGAGLGVDDADDDEDDEDVVHELHAPLAGRPLGLR
jgi:putative flippase GtrA